MVLTAFEVEDARRDVSPGVVHLMREKYVDSLPQFYADAFDMHFVTLAAQRHCKVAGTFTRLHRRDGKTIYLPHIPRVVGMLQRALNHPLMKPLREWFDDVFP